MSYQWEEELEKIQNSLKPPSVAILGRSGSGKSSLINAVFRVNTMKTGAGLPITKSYRKYPENEDKNTPIILYDSPGFEASKTDQYLKETIEFLNERSIRNNKDEKIHLVWYTIHAALSRIEPFDIEVIKTIYLLGIPLIILLTQVDIARPEVLQDLKTTILNSVFPEISKQTKQNNQEEIQKIRNNIRIINVAADPLPGKKQQGITELVEESINLIPTAYKEAFIYAQKINLKAKRKVAWTFIGGIALSTYTTAFIPVPGSAAAAVLISQASLLKILAKMYDAEKYLSPLLEVTKVNLTTGLTITATFVVEIAATTLGTIFAPLFFPTESFAGVLAASYIVIVGFAYTATLEHLVDEFYNTEKTQQELKEYIKRKFEENFKKYSSINLNNKESIQAYGNDFMDGKI